MVPASRPRPEPLEMLTIGRVTLLKVGNRRGTSPDRVHHVDVEGSLPVLLAGWDRQCADVADNDVQTTQGSGFTNPLLQRFLIPHIQCGSQHSRTFATQIVLGLLDFSSIPRESHGHFSYESLYNCSTDPLGSTSH